MQVHSSSQSICENAFTDVPNMCAHKQTHACTHINTLAAEYQLVTSALVCLAHGNYHLSRATVLFLGQLVLYCLRTVQFCFQMNAICVHESVFPASLSLPIAASALLLSRAAHTPVHSTFLPSTWKGTLPCTLTGEFKRTSLSCHLELEREEAVSAQ